MAEFIGLFGRVADAQVVECIVRKRYCSGGEQPHLNVFVEYMPTFAEMKAEALSIIEKAA